MQVNVLFFASMADRTGTSRWASTLPSSATIEDVKQMVIETFPHSAELLSICHVAVNQEYVKGNPVLQPLDEIAFFPPVSGG
ncbi:molybdopterin synthase sulfur carrier subunit [Paenibacillus abyssi]|uniref:Molybdopterin synthase sulfur carrier subunit n=1 Tax=Paenibacillus abyssi TaxID=1340531 RepID=A0A917FY28_9BACL|nr:molybdopterin synthase sulfur carrier subunit [Paenibacillus abyssi]